MRQAARKTGSLLVAALAAAFFYVAVRGYIATANGHTDDLDVQTALMISTVVLLLAAAFAGASWRLWPRQSLSTGINA